MSSVQLPPDLSAARRARVWLREQFPGRFTAMVQQTLELLTTELVTNAVRYGREPVELSVVICDCGEDGRDGPAVRVCVSDAGDAMPVLHHVAPGAVGGRGIALVDSVAQAWGSRARRPPHVGKTVWFELQVA